MLQYPPFWKIVELKVGEQHHDQNVVFDAIIETANHPINQAGHLSILNLPFLDFLKYLNDSKYFQSDALYFVSNGHTIKFFKIEYPITLDYPKQIDYDYAGDFGHYTIFIMFKSFDEPGKELTSKTLNDINIFVKTLSASVDHK
jgi:hypothetical protein